MTTRQGGSFILDSATGERRRNDPAGAVAAAPVIPPAAPEAGPTSDPAGGARAAEEVPPAAPAVTDAPPMTSRRRAASRKD